MSLVITAPLSIGMFLLAIIAGVMLLHIIDGDMTDDSD